MGIKWMIKKSDYNEIGKSVSKDADNKKLEALKKEVIAILEKKEKQEFKKAIKYFESCELNYSHLEKSIAGEWIEKAGYGVGTIRIWKGKKYKKVSTNPTRWVRVFDKNDRGAATSMGRYIAQVKKCESVEELYQFCMKQRSLFQDENGVDLPIMEKLRSAIGNQETHIKMGEQMKAYQKEDLAKLKAGNYSFNSFEDFKAEINKQAASPKGSKQSDYIGYLKQYNDKYLKEVYDAMNIKVTSGSSVKDWYKKEFPTDDLGDDLTNVSFQDIYDGIKRGTFKTADYANDSVVRERIFQKIAELKNIPYKAVYDQWLNAEQDPEEKKAKQKAIQNALNKQKESESNNDVNSPEFKKQFKESYKQALKDVKNLSDSNLRKELKHWEDAVEQHKDSPALASYMGKVQAFSEELADRVNAKESEAEKHQNRSDAMKGNQNARKLFHKEFEILLKPQKFAGGEVRSDGQIVSILAHSNKGTDVYNAFEDAGLTNIQDKREYVQNLLKEYKDSMKGNKNAYKGGSKEELQNQLLKLTEEKQKNLKQIKKLNDHKLELNEAKYSGIATDKDKAAIDEDFKETEKKINNLEDRNLEIEKEGNKLSESLSTMEDEEKTVNPLPPKQEKAFNDAVKKLEGNLKNGNHDRDYLKFNRSNYTINGEPMNIVTDGKILIAQKGHNSSLENGTVTSMERVYNSPGDKNIELPSGIDSVIKNANKTVISSGRKAESIIQVGDYLFPTKYLQMAQGVLGGLEGVKVVGSDNNKAPIKLEKDDISIVLMPEYNADESRIINSTGTKKEPKNTPKSEYSDIDENSVKLLTDEKAKELESKLEKEMLDTGDRTNYGVWQILHRENLDREHKKRAEEDKAEQQKQNDEKIAKENEIKEKYNGYFDNAKGLERSRAITNLEKKYNFDGKVMSVKDFVEQAIKDGKEITEREVDKLSGPTRTQWNRMTGAEQEAAERRIKEAGKVTKYGIGGYEFPKTVIDYAKYFKNLNKKSDVKKALFDIISMLDDSEDEELEPDFEDEDYSDYDASQPDLFNSTSYKVGAALDSIFGC